jgi:hypothetical protein
MNALAKIMADARSYFSPVPDALLYDSTNENKINRFWETCSPHVRTYLGILLCVRREYQGTVALISDAWLAEFASVDRWALADARRALQESFGLIDVQSLGRNKPRLYRLVNARNGKPFPTDVETNVEAVTRLKDPQQRKELSRTYAIGRWKKSVATNKETDLESSWSEW